MFMRRGASALGTAKPAVLPSGVATPRTGAMACKPQVDPAILLHGNPHAWVGHAAASAATTPLVD